MHPHDTTHPNRPQPWLSLFIGAVLLVAPAAHAGGGFNKVLNASLTPHYQSQPSYQQGNQQTQVMTFNLSVFAKEAGQPAQATVTIVVQHGSNETLQDIAARNRLSVRYTVFDLHGQARGTITKPPELMSSGGFQSALQFTPPRGIPHGHYRVDAELLIDGTPRATKSYDYQIL